MKVAIIGTAPASVGLAPYQDKDWEIWACAPGNRGVLPRVNLWFELHAIREMLAVENRAMGEPYFEWLRSQSDKGVFQVVMQEVNTWVPKAIPYPLHEMLAAYGHNWFASSIAYMMALAIERMKAKPGEAHEIGLWGVDMAATEELYSGQRASCIRFMELAAAAGIKVSVPQESCLAEPPPLYGYSESTGMARRINAIMHLAAQQRAALAAQVERNKLEVAFFDGAMEQLKYIQRTWLDGSEAVLDMGSLTEASKKYADNYFASPAAGRNAGAPVIPGTPLTAPALAAVSAIPTPAALPEPVAMVPHPAVIAGLNGSGGSGGYVEK